MLAAAAKSSVVSDSVRPHRWQPTRLPRPWDSPGKNTGVGCHFLLQCMKGKSENEAAQSCLTRGNPRNCSLPGSSVHGLFQARVLEWVATAFYSKGLNGAERNMSESQGPHGPFPVLSGSVINETTIILFRQAPMF